MAMPVSTWLFSSEANISALHNFTALEGPPRISLNLQGRLPFLDSGEPVKKPCKVKLTKTQALSVHLPQAALSTQLSTKNIT